MSRKAGLGREASASKPGAGSPADGIARRARRRTAGGRSPDQILAELEIWGQKLGLERIEKLLEAVGRPQDAVRTVLVAGTNGKGSTSALLAAIGHCAGARCGLYTSPHLEQVEERLRLDGKSIDSEELADLLTEVLAAAALQSSAPPTYFEALTAAAFLYFRRHRVDLAVFEVGLGGRLDATNVGHPSLSVITPIGFDHQEHLGKTLARIASEKAGIARRGRPLVTWSRRQPSVRETYRRIAVELDLDWFEADREVRLSNVDEYLGDAQLAEVELETPLRRYRFVSRLVGRHQLDNLGLAVRAAEILDSTGVLAMDREAIQGGVARCQWPGRLERVEIEGGRAVLLDGAHNLQGARALARYLAESGREWDLLYGSLQGKRAQVVLPLLAERCREVTLTRPASDRALDPEVLAGYLAARQPPAAVERDNDVALTRALDRSDRSLVVCGSLYLVGAVRRLLHARYGRPAPAVEVVTG